MNRISIIQSPVLIFSPEDTIQSHKLIEISKGKLQEIRGSRNENHLFDSHNAIFNLDPLECESQLLLNVESNEKHEMIEKFNIDHQDVINFLESSNAMFEVGFFTHTKTE